MIVVSDTTPLISLLKAERIDLLHTLFGEILIPEAVFRELTGNQLFQHEADIIRLSSFIRIVHVDEPKVVLTLQRATGLDAGESEAIAYADAHHADFLLVDEEAGRKVARAMGIRIMGTIGVFLNAYDDHLITVNEAETAFQKMRAANRHISKSLMDDALDYMKSK